MSWSMVMLNVSFHRSKQAYVSCFFLNFLLWRQIKYPSKKAFDSKSTAIFYSVYCNTMLFWLGQNVAKSLDSFCAYCLKKNEDKAIHPSSCDFFIGCETLNCIAEFWKKAKRSFIDLLLHILNAIYTFLHRKKNLHTWYSHSETTQKHRIKSNQTKHFLLP